MTATTHPIPLGDFTAYTLLGATTHPGSCTYDPGRQVYALTAPSDAPDDLGFAWQRRPGNFILTAQVLLDATTPHARLGWHVRTSLDPGAPHISTGVSGDGRPFLYVRRPGQVDDEVIGLPLSTADVLQIERRDTTYLVSVAPYGQPFVMTEVTDLDLSDEVYVGLACGAGQAEASTTGRFRNVRITVPAAPGFDRQRDPFGSRLEILEVATGHRQVLFTAGHVFEAPNWTRDGRALIYNSGGRLYRYDLASGEASPIDTGAIVRNNNDHVISFDGTMLAISSHEGPDYASLIYTVPLTGGTPQLVTPTGPSYLHGWSPDGHYLVYTALRHGDYDIYRIPAAGGVEEPLTTTPGLDDGPEYSPDGQYIYFNSVRSGNMQLWRMRADGSEQEQLTADACNNWFPHISPDGQQVVFLSYLEGEVDPSDHPAARRVYLRLMPAGGGEPRVLAYLYGGQGTINVPSWSPDGKYIAFVSNTVP